MRTRIMIVEDDPDIRALLGLELRASGYDTDFARDGLQALTVIRKTPPDLIVLDIGLPAGDGFTVLERLRNFAAFESIPVIVITAGSNPQNRERALAAGAVAFIQKPFSADTLVAAIEEVLVPASA